jgi:hypothetical protein
MYRSVWAASNETVTPDETDVHHLVHKLFNTQYKTLYTDVQAK